MREFLDGIFKKNPVFFLLLGLCPTLAVTTTLKNALGMAAATIFVLVCSSILISLIRKLIADEIRIPAFIVVIATFVTIVNLLMEAYYPEVAAGLGIYLMLIVVNCIVLGRALAFAHKNPVWPSFLDALGMGIGFSFALVVISTIRELGGTGQLLGYTINPFGGLMILALPPGALLVTGLILGYRNWRAS